MSDLVQKHCVACEGGTPPMPLGQARTLMDQVPGWELVDSTLVRRFKFKDFQAAMDFVNRVAGLAEAEGHHPGIHIAWNRVRLELTTHSIKGLSENDFIMAARINTVAGV